jgi:hypothetical protein
MSEHVIGIVNYTYVTCDMHLMSYLNSGCVDAPFRYTL